MHINPMSYYPLFYFNQHPTSMFTTIYATFKLSTPIHFYIHINIPATTLLITTKLSTKYISHTTCLLSSISCTPTSTHYLTETSIPFLFPITPPDPTSNFNQHTIINTNTNTTKGEESKPKYTPCKYMNVELLKSE